MLSHPWELTDWKRAKLHPDCHVVFSGAYYSGPHRLIGQRLWVRATDLKVELCQDYALVATHRRARPGQRRTLTAHLPPDKVHFLLQTPTWCRTRAGDAGPACREFIEQVLGDRPLDRLRSAQGILRLGQRYGSRGQGSLIKYAGVANWTSCYYLRGVEHRESTETPDLKKARAWHRQKLEQIASERQATRPSLRPR